jgi:hypothetical protein
MAFRMFLNTKPFIPGFYNNKTLLFLNIMFILVRLFIYPSLMPFLGFKKKGDYTCIGYYPFDFGCCGALIVDICWRAGLGWEWRCRVLGK